MRALWTGIHPIWVHYGPEPTLATINLHRGVSFTTYHPPRNHWGDTSHNQRVQPLSGKEADGTPALYRPEAPALKRPKGAPLLIYCEGRLPAHPTTVQIWTRDPQIVHLEPKSNQLNPEQESGRVLVFPWTLKNPGNLSKLHCFTNWLNSKL